MSGIRYAVKSFMEGDGYEMIVTDFSRCWGECLEGEGLTKRCKVGFVDTTYSRYD